MPSKDNFETNFSTIIRAEIFPIIHTCDEGFHLLVKTLLSDGKKQKKIHRLLWCDDGKCVCQLVF